MWPLDVPTVPGMQRRHQFPGSPKTQGPDKEQWVCKDTGTDGSYRNQIPSAHRCTRGSKAETRGTAGHTHTQRNALGIQFPPGSLRVYLMVNNATPSEAGWQILGGSQESRITSEEMWRKPGLEHCVPWGRQKRPLCRNRWEERWAGAGMPAQGHRELPVKSSQKSWKNKENICNTVGCSSYQSFEGTGGRKLGKAKENKNKPPNTPGGLLVHILLLRPGHEGLKFMWRNRSQGVSIKSFLFIFPCDKKLDLILPSKKTQAPCSLR